MRDCLGKHNLTTHRQRMFSKKAREYTLAYHALHQFKQQSTTTNNSQQQIQEQMSCKMIETIAKQYKLHRSVNDSEWGYINDIVKSMRAQ